MGLYADHVLPRLVHLAMRGEPFASERPAAVARARGRVLELGFGSGLNLPHYGPAVTELLALDPALLGRRLARPAIERAPFPVGFVELEGARFALEDDAVDQVVSTWTLCTIPDLAVALAEVRRVLRPGGALLFLEHGRSPDARVRRWQRRLEPLQKRLAGGCHLTRDVPALLRAAGYELRELRELDLRGPRVAAHHFRGVAAPA